MNGVANHRVLETILDTLDTGEACPGKSRLNWFPIFEHQPANLDVCHPVVVEVGAGGKAFATCLALVWLLSSVNTSVGVQRGAGGEPFLAEVTNIRPGKRKTI